ncbi:hypothetical protein OGATHE_006077 [Ogataea polymorpha]|uniref:Uncharacterized protein n=1 Tax=Ogataea polymorpha TaxID=460523 RepID=A0A9P8SYM0_9ASCO|nr:hypothetical protein OGATHE_006077 [Ogataea polymorpha]
MSLIANNKSSSSSSACPLEGPVFLDLVSVERGECSSCSSSSDSNTSSLKDLSLSSSGLTGRVLLFVEFVFVRCEELVSLRKLLWTVATAVADAGGDELCRRYCASEEFDGEPDDAWNFPYVTEGVTIGAEAPGLSACEEGE